MGKILKKLQKFLEYNIPKNKLIILPFSGGLNSATMLAVLRTIYTSQQIYLIHAVSAQNKIETKHAHELASQYGVELHVFDISTLKESFNDCLDLIIKDRIENTDMSATLVTTNTSSLVYVLARAVTRELNGALVGTVDLTEILTGYYSKECFGGDFLPMGGLTRAELRSLAQECGIKVFLPERWSPSPGCGNIAPDISKKIITMGGKTVFKNEDELQNSIDNFIESLPLIKDDLGRYINTQLHKIRLSLLGRSVFFSSQERERKIMEFITKN